MSLVRFSGFAKISEGTYLQSYEISHAVLILTRDDPELFHIVKIVS